MDYRNMNFKYYYQRDITWRSSDNNYKKTNQHDEYWYCQRMWNESK